MQRVEDAIALFEAYSAPIAYCADFGLTVGGQTILVEVNDAIAFGDYGLAPVYMGNMIIERWNELTLK